MHVEEISKDNITDLTKLVLELWPECAFDEEYRNYEKVLLEEGKTCFLIKDRVHYIAFIYLTLHIDYVEGTTTSPVAYIEGLYVKPEYRKSGIGKKLVEIGERWAKDMGCREYASDTDLGNKQSIAFHKRAGFKEVTRIVCFVKEIE